MTGPNVPTVQPSTAALTDATEHAHTAEHSGRTAQQQHPEAELEQSAPGNPSPAELQQAQQLKQELEQEPEKGVMQVADPAAGEPEAEMTCAWHELEVKPVVSGREGTTNSIRWQHLVEGAWSMSQQGAQWPQVHQHWACLTWALTDSMLSCMWLQIDPITKEVALLLVQVSCLFQAELGALKCHRGGNEGGQNTHPD
jgi:hypothetical protein